MLATTSEILSAARSLDAATRRFRTIAARAIWAASLPIIAMSLLAAPAQARGVQVDGKSVIGSAECGGGTGSIGVGGNIGFTPIYGDFCSGGLAQSFKVHTGDGLGNVASMLFGEILTFTAAGDPSGLGLVDPSGYASSNLLNQISFSDTNFGKFARYTSDPSSFRVDWYSAGVSCTDRPDPFKGGPPPVCTVSEFDTLSVIIRDESVGYTEGDFSVEFKGSPVRGYSQVVRIGSKAKRDAITGELIPPYPDIDLFFNKASHPSANRKLVIRANAAGGLFVADPAGVPEPSAWALMIAGFGLVGGALRIRRRPTFA